SRGRRAVQQAGHGAPARCGATREIAKGRRRRPPPGRARRTQPVLGSRLMAAQTPDPPMWTHTDSDANAQMAPALEVRRCRVNPDGSPMTHQDRVRLVGARGCATAYAIENAGAGGVRPADEMGAIKLGSVVRGSGFDAREAGYAASTLGRTWMLFP